MEENEFWRQLEYRAFREIMADERSRRMAYVALDGFIPERYDLGEHSTRIEGIAWVLGVRGDGKWTFTANIDRTAETTDRIEWDGLIPGEDASPDWLVVDLERQHFTLTLKSLDSSRAR